MTKEYAIQDDWDGVIDIVDSLEDAERIFESVKESKMECGVQFGESFVSLIESDNDFKTETTIKKVVATFDEELTRQIGTPQQNGYEWNYWAKWQEVEL